VEERILAEFPALARSYAFLFWFHTYF